MVEAQIAMGMILSAFRFRRLDAVPLRPVPGITLRPDRALRVRLEPR